MRRLYGWLSGAALLLGAPHAAAQYYSWGSDAPMKWSQLRTDDQRIVFPDSAENAARRTLFYADRIRHDIGYGFTYGPMRMPFVLHAQNFAANGMVMYLPKRVELLTIPDAESYAMPWLKQLTAHEYRHTVQYGNLNRGFFRVLRILAGQQSPTVGLLCMPAWAIEGDAVMAETQMSTFGRALQPSFTLGYRAMGRVGTDRTGSRYRRNTDKWFCGSYREHIPDHYRLGYQINAYAYDRYGENIWDKVVARAVRRPYYFATTHTGLKKYYGTTVNRLFRETFDALQAHWDSLPQRPDSAQPLVELPDGNYTVYRWPQPLDDATLLVLKEDYDRPARFVVLDVTTGRERHVAYTGNLSSRPVVQGRRVWWTEFRRSMLFEERVNSQLCYLDLDERRPHTVDSLRRILYPTPQGDCLTWVTLSPQGRYVVTGTHGNRIAMPFGTEIHGLAWDACTQSLCGLITDDSGMWIARIDSDGLHPLTQGAYVTLSDLRSDGCGRLYFGSIASGKDEAYCLDLAGLQQTSSREADLRTSGHNTPDRITESHYGAFAPAPMPDGQRAVVTLYDRRGYRPAMQALDSLRPTPWRETPVNSVNPERRRWPVVNLDTVSFTPADERTQERVAPARRYRKALHALNIHSWLPVAFDPFDAVDEQLLDLNFGATVLSQNLLSNTEAFASYGWNRDEGSLVRAGLRYDGWGVRLGFGASYGGNQQVYRLSTANPDYDAETNPDVDKTLYQPLPKLKKYYSLEASASLPLLFQRGYRTRQLTLSAVWNYSNGKIADLSAIRRDEQGRIVNIDAIGYRDGLHKLQFGIRYAEQVRMAHRDFAPRYGWAVQASYAVNPANDDFSQLLVGYAQLYLPGFARHHSLKLAATYQTSVGGAVSPSGNRPLSYRSSLLIPTGFASSAIYSDHYRAASLDYQLPVWYPDGGICSVLYIKRIRLNLGGQAAQFRMLTAGGLAQRRIWSVGGDVIFDFNALRLPASGTSTFRLSVYRPSSGSVWVGGSFGLPF